MKQLYEVKDGKVNLLISFDEYRDVIFNLGLSPEMVENVMFNRIKGDYGLVNGYNLSISVDSGIGTFSLYSGNTLEFRWECKTFQEFWSFQMDMWMNYGIPLTAFIVDDIVREKYSSVLFYPPVGERTIWDYTEPDIPVNEKKVWSGVKYNDDGTFSTFKIKYKKKIV